MLDEVDNSRLREFQRSQLFEGEVPSVVGKWVAVVRIRGIETWIFCNESQVKNLPIKYRNNFIRVAGKVLVDNKPVRIPKVCYSTPDVEVEELFEFPEEYRPSDEEEAEFETKSNDGILRTIDLPKVRRAIDNLNPEERSFFDLWSANTSMGKITTILKLSKSQFYRLRREVQDRLFDYVGAKNPEDFETRIHSISQTLGNSLGSTQWQKTKESAPEYNPMIDIPRLVTGLNLLTDFELRYFQFWSENIDQDELKEILNISNQAMRRYRTSIRKKLSSYVGAKSVRDFDRRIHNVNTLLKKTLGDDYWPKIDEGREDPDMSVDIPALAQGLSTLTHRERMLFNLWSEGKGSSVAALKLHVSHNTVNDYKQIIKRKLRPFVGVWAWGSVNFEKKVLAISSALNDYLKTNEKSVEMSDETLNDGGPTAPDALLSDLSNLANGVAMLSPMELQMFRLWSDKVPSKELASVLEISMETMRGHKRRIRIKLMEIFGARDIKDFECRIHAVWPRLNTYLAGLVKVEEFVSSMEMAQEVPVPIVQVEQRNNESAITFNDFLQAYGSRKDAIKALEQFNRIPAEQRPVIMADIPKYKASLVHANYQMSPYQYLMGRSWAK